MQGYTLSRLRRSIFGCRFHWQIPSLILTHARECSIHRNALKNPPSGEFVFTPCVPFAQPAQDTKGLRLSLAAPVQELLRSVALLASPINISNVGTSDGNIHAGVKMLRNIADTYFNDPKIDPVNKTLFVFASYNAGPNRIAKLRKEAVGMGLDPNVWFGNVELVAAKEIGQETVTYIANIYKYYVAYKLAVEQRQIREKARGLPAS